MRTLLVFLLATQFLCVACAADQGKEIEKRAATSRKETEPELLVARAKAFASAGDFTRAEQYLSAALERGGDPGAILPLLVEIEIRDKRYRAAAAHLRDHLRTHPSDVRARFVLASLYSALELPDEARAQLEDVLAANPKHSEATYALAVIYRDSFGDYQGADRYFRRYLELEPRGRHRDEAEAALLTRMR